MIPKDNFKQSTIEDQASNSSSKAKESTSVPCTSASEKPDLFVTENPPRIPSGMFL